MTFILKLKRSETAGSSPTANDLEVGEVAMNTVDQTLFTKTSAGNIVTIANYSLSDPSLTFPTGDLGALSSSTDAFGQSLTREFDSLDTPNGTLSTQDLGTLS